MAFVSRQPRHTDFTYKSAVQSNVGPGSYNTNGSRRFGAVKRMSPAPFSTSKERETGCIQYQFSPGPGDYNTSPKRNMESIPGARGVFKSKTKRSPLAHATDTPGPGEYSVSGRWLKASHNRSSMYGGGLKSRVPNTALHSERGDIEWVRLPTAASIPTKAQKFGFKESESGDLVMETAPYKTHSGTTKDSAGPGEYDVEKINLSKKKGTSIWSRSKTKRNLPFRNKFVPGPGKYQAKVPSKKTNTGSQKLSSMASKSKRFSEHTTQGPGPAYYDKVVVRALHAATGISSNLAKSHL